MGRFQEAPLSSYSHAASLKQGRPLHKSHQGCRGQPLRQSLVLARLQDFANSPSLGRCRIRTRDPCIYGLAL
jgi:hypothetical protein